MRVMSIEEVRLLLEKLGRNDDIVIISDGTPVGRLLPPELPKGVPIYGRGKGMLSIISDDDEHLKDFAEYMP